MNKVLKNINFWGMLICNLVIGNFTMWHLNSAYEYGFKPFISFSIPAILSYFILFFLINFGKSTNWKLLLYSFGISVIILFINCIVFGIIMELSEPVGLNIIGFGIYGIFMTMHCNLFITIITFLWLLKEKNDYKKKNEINTNN